MGQIPIERGAGDPRALERAVAALRAGHAIEGTTDFVRFPKRPRISISFLTPAAGQPRPDEDPAELAARLLGEIRALAPPVAAGRGIGT